MAKQNHPRRDTPSGTITRAAGKHGAQVMRSAGRFWTNEAEEIFLDTLACSCNVELSAAATGFSATTIYRRRRDDSAFAARWQAALEQGYDRLELAMVGAAIDSLAGLKLDADRPFVPMSVADALNLLKLHRTAAKTGERAQHWRARTRGLDEVRASILRKLDAIERAQARGDDPAGLIAREPGEDAA